MVTENHLRLLIGVCKYMLYIYYFYEYNYEINNPSNILHCMRLFLDKDMQTPPPLKKRCFDFLVQIVEKRFETNEKRKI